MPCVDAYRNKLDPAALAALLASIEVYRWETGYDASVTWSNYMDKVGEIVMKYGLSPLFIPALCAYAQQLLYIRDHFHPSVWAWPVDYFRELKIVVEKWLGRGLNAEVMLIIAWRLGVGEAEAYFP